MKRKLENKTVFITGGLSGIGKACAIAAAKEGANIAIADRERNTSIAAMNEIKAIQPNTIHIECNVSIYSDVEEAIKTVYNTFGRLDVALNNAGIGGKPCKLADMEVESWLHVLDVNLNGIFYCMKLELQQMIKQGGGVIVNMSSITGKVGYAKSAHYVASKHGILGITQTAALEYATEGIRINAICPGFINTPLLDKLELTKNDAVKKHLCEMHPMNRLGNAEEVAKGFIFLACDDSSYMTGTALEIDGGFLAK
jgi:NAD(P)-dependent dehydrogenase (short-subunit alcohol dehydrogenase family)